MLTPTPVRVVPEAFVDAAAAAAAAAGASRPVCASGCTSGGSPSRAARPAPPTALRGIARAAEEAGFDAIYVMDHFRQIPQVGRAWEDFLESYTTLGLPGGVHRHGCGSARWSPA